MWGFNRRISPGPGQESVWDYPRPPALEPVQERLRVVFAGETVADTIAGYRVLETSHPPAYYFPPEDVARQFLEACEGQSSCEWKGAARYWDLNANGTRSERAAWSYPQPGEAFEKIRGYFAFYAARVDECWVGEERARPQPGGFYGGWITSRVVGPFKGGPGSLRW